MADELPLGLTVDQLREAVRSNRSWRGVLRSVGSTSAHRGRQLRGACDELGIDYRHFRDHGFTDEELAGAVRAASTWSEVLGQLGYGRDSGSARATLRRHCQRLGLDVEHLADRPLAQAADLLHRPPQPRHLRHAGAYVVAGRLALAGHRISWPLEPAPYDLLVDSGVGLRRVQVKTTTSRSGSSWICSITRSEYADVPGGKLKAFYGPDEIDDFAVVDGDLGVYLIPVLSVVGIGTLSLRKYRSFLLPPWPAAASAAG